MDYLRNLGSAAVSTLVQKSGINLPFTLGSKVASCETLWNLYDATKRDDGSPVSVFEYDLIHPLNKPTIPLARNALRKLRTIRHPDVLKFMDVVESDSAILIMTERVRPLPAALQAWASKGTQERDWLLWGLHRISVALAFINDSASSTHGNIRPSAIFISPSGEWKLGGFELLSNPKDDLAVLYTMGSLFPDGMTCAPPEVKKSGWSSLKDGPIYAADSYTLGLLLHSVFNPTHTPPPTAQPPHPPPQPSSRGSIPTPVFPSFKKLLNPNPKGRLSPKDFLEIGMAETTGDGSGFFSNNRLVRVCGGLDNFSLGSEAEKATLLRTLKESTSSFPPEFASFRVLPSLVSALEFGGASAATIVPLVLQFSKSVPNEDYTNVVLAPLVKLYASPDRGTRMALLDNLPEYSDKLDKKSVVDKIWPNLQTGFSDTVAVVREATVRAIVLLAPKLNDRILNNDLLRHLARMQNDSEASIRTNTCILIGRLGPTLGYNTKRKVLVPAFSRALKDPFVHARVAGLMAFMATSECFGVEDVAGKVIPSIAGAMLDKEKLVRDQAFKAMELFIKKLEAHAASMPETAIVEGDGNENVPPSIPGGFTQANVVNSATGAAGALTGWAISSIGRKLASSDMQTTIASAPERPTSTPPLSSNSGRASPATFNESSRPKGLQLTATKARSQLADEVAAQESTNPWSNDDLIDIHADEGDWSAFESAPPVVVPKPVPAVGLGLSVTLQGSLAPADEWGAMESSTFNANTISSSHWGSPPQPASRAISPQPQSQTRKPSGSAPRYPVAFSPPSSSRPTPVPSPQPLPVEVENATRPMASMSKEGKAAEMARRKEERRLRIEKLKEQKKTAAATARQ